MSRTLRTLSIVAALGVALALPFCLWGCHGHIVRGGLAPNHAGDFDFRRPPCDAAPRPPASDGDVLLKYLGTSGLYLEWKGTAILSAPFFSNPSKLRAAFGRVRWDEAAVRRGLSDLDLAEVRAVFAGHSHFDHLGDLPLLLPHLHPGARLLLNRSGWKMIGACDGAAGRWVDIEERTGEWIWLEDADGGRLPIRLMPVESGHADHFWRYHYAAGEVPQPWEACDWERRRLRSMKEGRVFAFLIDLMSDDLATVEFRIHFQGAAASKPLGFPAPEVVDERPADLVVVCMPSFWLVDGYPEGILEHVRARHVLVTHYEDFFRDSRKPLRFVPLLTNDRAERFLERVRDQMSREPHRPTGPDPCPCGPCSNAWTMPLPGEWLRFHR